MTKQEAKKYVDEYLHYSYEFIRFYGYGDDYIYAQVVRKSNGWLYTFIIDFKNQDIRYEEE